mmetsp:Transcript_989/g.1245  ORF Transcript_989/g.1245 Transcript_989/m.1245 type:complete len:257 (-) Transcript_989:377-1147(-)
MSWWGNKKQKENEKRLNRKEEYLDDPYKQNDGSMDEQLNKNDYDQSSYVAEFEEENIQNDGSETDWSLTYESDEANSMDNDQAQTSSRERSEAPLSKPAAPTKKEYRFQDLQKESRGNIQASSILCGLSALANGGQGFVLGSVFGGISGFMEARSFNLSGADLQKHVIATSLRHAKELGIITSVTSGVKCGMFQLRGTKDSINSFVAGAAAGSILAARRHAPLNSIVGNAVMFGAGMVVFDSIGSSSNALPEDLQK